MMDLKNFFTRRRFGGQSGTSHAADHSRHLCQNQVHSINTSGNDVQKKQGLSSCRGGSSPVAESHPPPAPVNANVPSYDAVPTYVQDLASSRQSGAERAARALRKLFAISQVVANPETRNDVPPRFVDGDLIPALLTFLRRCDRERSEQYMALLILNNLSIPDENKRAIAIDFDGAKILCRLLVEDPSCHLVAIVLVNLTFADPELRSALVSQDGDIHLIESLSFALRVASLTREEYERRQALLESDLEYPNTPSERLANLLAEDVRKQSILEDDSAPMSSVEVPPPSLQQFPETARWCLAALKNLTRPATDPTAACSLIKVGIVPHILRFLKVDSVAEVEPMQAESLPIVRFGQSKGSSTSNSLRDESSCHSSQSQRSSRAPESSICDSDSSGTPVPTDPEAELSEYCTWNSTSTWDDKSAQDAALFVILNLSTFPIAREYIRKIDAVHHLFAITAASETKPSFRTRDSAAEELREFQRLKARMALSYLLGADGQFGFTKHRGIGKKVIYASLNDIALMIHETEVRGMVALLANTIHRRSKAGPGGYSATTFSTKHVLLALRRLLASYENQVKMAHGHGAQINALLLKAVALHAFRRESHIDAEAAEYACFSLYLLSSYGFQVRRSFQIFHLAPLRVKRIYQSSNTIQLKAQPFLPSSFGNVDVAQSLVAKVLTAYSNRSCTSPAGKHAACQLLLRLKYLVFNGTAVQLAAAMGAEGSASDFSFGPSLEAECRNVAVTNLRAGARPDENIFDRPILRRRLSRHLIKNKRLINWNDNEAVDFFPNVLQAVGDFSFNSTEVRHMDAIDDILIANNIAHSANGEKTESYNYMWSWQDTAGEIQRHLEHQQSSDSFLTFVGQGPSRNNGSIDFIDFLCGS